ncbi:hypothetical protein Tco_1154584 [Tanacetum coccineum]
MKEENTDQVSLQMNDWDDEGRHPNKLAHRLHEEELAEIERIHNEKATQEEVSMVAIYEEYDNTSSNIAVMPLADTKKFRELLKRAARDQSIRPPTKTQLRNLMMTYLKNMGGYKHSQLKGKTYEEIQGLYEREQKFIHDFVPMDSKKEEKKLMEPESDRNKKREKQHEYENETKKTGNQRLDGSSSYHGDTQAFLRRLDRQDLNDLYRLVQERFQDYPLEGHDLLLWEDLRMLFDPDEKDELWMNKLDWKLLKWKLYESCRVHTLFMDGTPMEINMLVEKKYPLIKELLEKDVELAVRNKGRKVLWQLELIKFIKSMLEE